MYCSVHVKFHLIFIYGPLGYVFANICLWYGYIALYRWDSRLSAVVWTICETLAGWKWRGVHGLPAWCLSKVKTCAEVLSSFSWKSSCVTFYWTGFYLHRWIFSHCHISDFLRCYIHGLQVCLNVRISAN